MEKRFLLTNEIISREALRISKIHGESDGFDKSIDFDFSEQELCLSLDDFSEKILEPARKEYQRRKNLSS